METGIKFALPESIREVLCLCHRSNRSCLLLSEHSTKSSSVLDDSPLEHVLQMWKPMILWCWKQVWNRSRPMKSPKSQFQLEQTRQDALKHRGQVLMDCPVDCRHRSCDICHRLRHGGRCTIRRRQNHERSRRLQTKKQTL